MRELGGIACDALCGSAELETATLKMKANAGEKVLMRSNARSKRRRRQMLHLAQKQRAGVRLTELLGCISYLHRSCVRALGLDRCNTLVAFFAEIAISPLVALECRNEPEHQVAHQQD